MRINKLAVGDKFTFTGLEDLGIHILLNSSFTGTTVKSIKRERRTFETMHGDLVDFNAPGRSLLVGTNTLVEKVD